MKPINHTVVEITGPAGCGKSRTARVLAAMLRANGATVVLHDDGQMQSTVDMDIKDDMRDLLVTINVEQK